MIYRDPRIAPGLRGMELPKSTPERQQLAARLVLLDFLRRGLNGEWDEAAKYWYGFATVDALEEAWLEWLKTPPSRTGAAPKPASPQESDLIPPAKLTPDGSGPGPRPAVRSGQGRTSIRFTGPAGMKVTWQLSDGGFNPVETGLTAPKEYNFAQEQVYRLRLTQVRPNLPGRTFYPTLEVLPASPKTATFLSHSTVPVSFTDEDFDQVAAGNLVVKVIYLSDPAFQGLVPGAAEVIVSTRLEPGADPIQEAQRRGSILAIVRLGNIDLENRSSPAVVTPRPKRSPAEALPHNARQVVVKLLNPPGERRPLREVRLFVSRDEGRTWTLEATAPADRDTLNYTAPADGIYWFTAVRVFADGTQEPDSLTDHRAEMKVLVDTTPPVVRLLSARRDGRFVRVDWEVEDANRDDAGTVVEYRPAGSNAGWTRLAIGTHRTHAQIDAPNGGIEVRVKAKDRAGNEGSTTKVVE
jgi:hypothetical protein